MMYHSNATEEIAVSANYPEIREFTVSLQDSPKTEIDFLGIDEMWSVAEYYTLRRLIHP